MFLFLLLGGEQREKEGVGAKNKKKTEREILRQNFFLKTQQTETERETTESRCKLKRKKDTRELRE